MTEQFFFNENMRVHQFFLHSESIKYFRHEESMVRIAVRTITLNVYRVKDEAMRTCCLSGYAFQVLCTLEPSVRAATVSASGHGLKRRRTTKTPTNAESI